MDTLLKSATLAVISFTFLGCGSSEMGQPLGESITGDYQEQSSSDNSFQQSSDLDLAARPHATADQANSSRVAGEQTKATVKSKSTVKAQSTRKIIYTANLNLDVESFAGVADSILRLSQQCEGFVARANISGTAGDRRRGSWTLRVPTERYRDFLASAGDLGEISSLNEQTKEVTAEFYDVDARIRNKLREEERLNKILEERPGKLTDVLTVEKEVSRVREEIERMQGRLRVLKDLTSYSTISITVTEIQHYAPPAAPTFGTLIERQWQSTVGTLTAAFQASVLWAIAVGPWLIIAGLIGSLCVLANRRLSPKQVR